MTPLAEKPVLIVDDEKHIRAFLANEIERLGFARILQAANGKEALEIYRKHHPFAILLDINMPEMNGEDVLQAIRLEDDSVMIVMVTAMISQHSIEKCADLGADYFISKGAPPKQIRVELERIFHPLLEN
ncbi:MAG: response regulator transcription factor [Opitutales bacterium]